jgi:hypothetical protein
MVFLAPGAVQWPVRWGAGGSGALAAGGPKLAAILAASSTARARWSAVAWVPRQMTVMPSPTMQGVLGMARTTGFSAPSSDSSLSVEAPARAMQGEQTKGDISNEG